jgi:hypothetical protein
MGELRLVSQYDRGHTVAFGAVNEWNLAKESSWHLRRRPHEALEWSS